MKPLRLFAHLVKFHVLSVPWYLWLFLLGFSGFLIFLQGKLNHDADIRTGDNLFMVFYLFILAAQLSWGINGGTAAGSTQTWANGSRDFLWTRAVDRGVLFWSKLAVFAAICSLVWVDTSVMRLFRASPVTVSLYDGPQDRAFKKALLDTPALAARVQTPATPERKREVIALERGNGVLAALCAWKVTAFALLILWLVGGLRLNLRWLLGIFFAFLFLWYAVVSGASAWSKIAWLDTLEYRHQVLMYARAGLWWWLGLWLVGFAIVMDTRRRYRRPA